MQVPVFRAKDADSNEVVEGFYFEYPLSSLPVNMIQADTAHCLLTFKPALGGMVNEPVGCTIDFGTLEFVRYVDVPCKGPQIIL